MTDDTSVGVKGVDNESRRRRRVTSRMGLQRSEGFDATISSRPIRPATVEKEVFRQLIAQLQLVTVKRGAIYVGALYAVMRANNFGSPEFYFGIS
ncbi:hypothetical protein HPP92_009563 [Vanilla planifolia]|uniref:Uncharacterized protein n=1 Tax=Vanilla planifolia TaxID=51239 RepID=A0A835RBR8_VANPL|nr:hypothetical protein HPP92_009779 [Vanilla planifolia]KAG0487468.1 hypothetical protein HPP92_009563 [Vanilla planifolia]